MKILGILILLAGSLVFLIGLGGAVMNFVFPPTDRMCKNADEKMKEAEVAVKVYEAAKGTPDEFTKKAAADQAIQSASGWNDSCGRMKETYRSYGLVFSGIGAFGGFIFLVGVGIAVIGFRRKKLA